MHNRNYHKISTIIIITALHSLFAANTFYVEGRYLHDPCGEQFIIRGANVMTLYWDGYGGSPDGDWSKTGDYTFSQLSKTGANCARIPFWHHHGGEGWRIPASFLDYSIKNCIKYNMLPMPELHDATGLGCDAVNTIADYWLSDDIVAVLKAHQAYILVNIANEANVGASNFVSCYTPIITRFREAGLHMPLVIDGPGNWAQDEDPIIDNAQTLINNDPDHNLIFSWHCYQSASCGSNPGTQSRIKSTFDRAVEKNICFILGEFSHKSGHPGCEEADVEYEYMMSYANEVDIGWLAWAWWCCSDGGDHHSLTYDKMYGHWSNAPYGESVTMTHPAGINKTAKRTQYLNTRQCNCPPEGCPDPDTSGNVDPNLTPAILYNPSFESNLTGWDNWQSVAEIVTAADNVRDETKAIKLPAGQQAGIGQTIYLKAGTTYILKGWGRNSSEITDASQSSTFGVAWHLPDGTEPHHVLAFTESEYTFKEMEFTTPEDMTEPRFFIWKNAADVDFFVDGIELYVDGGTDVALRNDRFFTHGVSFLPASFKSVTITDLSGRSFFRSENPVHLRSQLGKLPSGLYLISAISLSNNQSIRFGKSIIK